MHLIDFIKRLKPGERADFAVEVGTTVGHLNNVVYGTRVPSAALARQIAIKTRREVPEWQLRPEDWHLIWPELVGAEGAPAIPTQEASHAA